MAATSEESEVIYVRRAEIADAKGIDDLTTEDTRSIFGRFNAVSIIEKAVFSVSVTNDKDEIVGHASFYDYPGLEEVNSAEWEPWIGQFPSLTHFKPINTLFCHVLVARHGYTEGITGEILRAVFNAATPIQQILLTPPTHALPAASLALDGLFGLAEGIPDSLPYEIRSSHRHAYCPVLHIRPARVEDHDDLTPIFNKQNDVLTSTYGSYFLAELIEAQDDFHKAIVAEVDGTAIGFMSLSADVDVDLLASCFELVPFHGLRKKCDADSWEERTESRKSSQVSLTSELEESRPSSVAAASKQEFPSRPGSAISSIQSRSLIESLVSLADVTKTRLSVISQSSLATASGTSVGTTTTNAKSIARSAVSADPQPAAKQKRTVQFPVYKGLENAFCIQLFCIDEKYEMRSMDLLPGAFDLFPDKDFCIITQPHTTPEYPLLKNFMRITPRPTTTLHQELYIAHRCSLFDDVVVRLCVTGDRGGIEAAIKGVENAEGILKDVDQFNKARRDPQDEGSTPLAVYVTECQSQVIGVCVIRDERSIEYIRSHFDIESFIYYGHHRREEHAHLYHFVLNPVFGHYTKHVLKEVLRLSHKTNLYYPVYPAYETTEAKAYSLATCLNDLIPVRARRQIVYPLEKLGQNAPSTRITQQLEPFALYHMNRKLTLEPKIAINSRIVVVGASDVGLSFLEAISFSPHLRFNNLTLLSPNGLPSQSPADSVADNMLPTSHCFSRSEFAQISLATWVNVVKGKLVAIDRERKVAMVHNGAELPYDLLILCTGIQYQANAIKAKSAFTLNDEKNCKDALAFLKRNVLDGQGHVVVYGAPLDAYSAMEALLKSGLNGSQIDVVKPPLEVDGCFNNSTIDELVEAEMKKLGITVHENCVFASWNEADDIVQFSQGEGKLELNCKAFLALDHRGIDYDVFRAINDSCLVFDGRLVVDADFRTNDAFIRGAGPLTKFARRYHADQWSFGHFCSREVGRKLAFSVLCDYDPVAEPREESSEDDGPPVIPQFSQPKIVGAKLPGGYSYLRVGPPVLAVSPEIERRQGRILATRDAECGYFEIRVDRFSRVREMTCLTKQELETSNLLCLYNLNEKYLNKMVDRYDEGLIKSFYSFFREPWALTFFHDRFADFRDEIREIVATRMSPDAPSLEEHVQNLLRIDAELAPLDEDNLKRDYGESDVRKKIDKRLFNFLSYNRYHLSMYARQQMV